MVLKFITRLVKVPATKSLLSPPTRPFANAQVSSEKLKLEDIGAVKSALTVVYNEKSKAEQAKKKSKGACPHGNSTR